MVSLCWNLSDQTVYCGVYRYLPGQTDVPVLFQDEAGVWSRVECHGLKAVALAFQREVESWLGPFGTESKNGSVMLKRGVDGLVSLAFIELLLASICVIGSWL